MGSQSSRHAFLTMKTRSEIRKAYKRKRKTVVATIFGTICFYCREAAADTFDHLMPKSLGGVNTIDNLVPACLACNQAKADRLPTTAEMARHREFWRKYNHEHNA